MTLYPHLNPIFELELLAELESKAVYTSVKAGEILIATGQLIRQVPIVLSGSVKILRIDDEGNEILLYYLSETESCAMTFTCCMQQFPSEVQAVAEEDTDLLFLPITLMDGWMAKYPSWRSFCYENHSLPFSRITENG